MTMPLERWDEFGEEGRQALGTDFVCRRPRAGQGLLHDRAVVWRSRSSDRRWRTDWAEEQANGVLALVARDGDELVEDDRPLAVPGGSIPRCDLDQQLALGAEAHRRPHSSPSARSSLANPG